MFLLFAILFRLAFIFAFFILFFYELEDSNRVKYLDSDKSAIFSDN